MIPVFGSTDRVPVVVIGPPVRPLPDAIDVTPLASIEAKNPKTSTI